MTETDDQRADRLAEVCLELVDRLRTEPAEPLLHELLGALDRLDLYGVASLLAAATDPTYSPEVWWGWVRYGVTAMTAPPVTWDDLDPPEAEPLTGKAKTGPDAVDRRIAELARLRKTDREIGLEVGLSRDAVAARRKRQGIPAGGQHLTRPVRAAAKAA